MMRRSVPTVVVEQRTIPREGLVALLHDTSYRVVASVATISEVNETCLPAGRPALVIFGASNGVAALKDAIQLIGTEMRDSKIVVVADWRNPVEVQDILNVGADGIILNVNSREVLLRALDLAFLEQKFVVVGDLVEKTSEYSEEQKIAPSPGHNHNTNGNGSTNGGMHHPLSEREHQILCYVARGYSNKMIARACSIAEATVKVHLKGILRKVEAHNRTQAAMKALETGLLNLRDYN